ncbi:MAG: hypothetical protein JW751_18625 [Polyangiaceae bacterium]|nr:hypothetical protein [Polyangiaceae bacterium]
MATIAQGGVAAGQLAAAPAAPVALALAATHFGTAFKPYQELVIGAVHESYQTAHAGEATEDGIAHEFAFHTAFSSRHREGPGAPSAQRVEGTAGGLVCRRCGALRREARGP